ncbi:MAG: hypothetical protein K2H20_03715, partial [Bacilli bacterium]|nr:hypothetical protein [Bacilli bacterium]
MVEDKGSKISEKIQNFIKKPNDKGDNESNDEYNERKANEFLNEVVNETVKGKCRKSAGIITLQFNERSQNLTNAEGNGMSIQTPYNNCLHVFLGNVQRKDNNGSISSLENKILEKKRELSSCTTSRLKNILTLTNFKDSNDKLVKQLSENKISEEEYHKKNICTNEIINKAISIIDSNQDIKNQWENY